MNIPCKCFDDLWLGTSWDRLILEYEKKKEHETCITVYYCVLLCVLYPRITICCTFNQVFTTPLFKMIDLNHFRLNVLMLTGSPKNPKSQNPNGHNPKSIIPKSQNPNYDKIPNSQNPNGHNSKSKIPKSQLWQNPNQLWYNSNPKILTMSL